MAKPPINIQSLARNYSETAIRSLGVIAAQGASEAARVAACIALLDRGWGRAPQMHSVEGDGEIRVIIRHIIDGKDVTPKTIEHSKNKDIAED